VSDGLALAPEVLRQLFQGVEQLRERLVVDLRLRLEVLRLLQEGLPLKPAP
jgi:hypothetical protein